MPMHGKSIEADDNQKDHQAERPQESQSLSTLFAEKEPPDEQWATCEVTTFDGKVIESFRVPFTQEELDLIKMLREKKNHHGLVKGSVDGGPEREHRQALIIPYLKDLLDRKRTIAILRLTLDNADKILDEGKFTPGLNSKEPIAEIRDALGPLIE